MKVFAVIDTNVIVSALLSRNGETPVVKVFQALMDKKITLMVNDEIISEYKNVLNRPKEHEKNKLHQSVKLNT